MNIECPKCGADLVITETIKDGTAADRVIRAFGGVVATAELLGLDRAAVYRWDYPREKRGCGGSVPSKHHAKILEISAVNGFDITRSDLINT